MRQAFSLLCFVALLLVALPARAQLRSAVPAEAQAATKLYGSNTPAFTLNRLFSPEHFQMQHSFEFSTGAFGGQGYSFGMYTNTMNWQFSDKLAARVDVSYLQPFGGPQVGLGQQQGQLFLQNAEVAYRPLPNMQLNLSVRQSPYGAYMSPYGYGPAYGPGYGSAYRADPFWRDAQR